MKPALRHLGWTSFTILGACVGFFLGLAIAPELSKEMQWALAIAIVAIFVASWVVRHRRIH